MSTNPNIQSILQTAERIFEATHTVLSQLPNGERVQIKQLAQDVGTLVGLDPKRVLGYVNDFAHNNDISYVTRGKNGGVIRGTKPATVVKPAKKAKKTVVATTDAASDSTDNS